MSSPATHDHRSFLAQFSKSRGGAARDLRVRIIEGTMGVLASPNRDYVCSDTGETHSVPRGDVGATVKFTLEDFTPGAAPLPRMRPSPEDASKTRVMVIEGDCLEVCANLVRDGVITRPLVLNMSSPRRPGGGYLTGAGAQEENIFRRSDYCELLPASFYRLAATDAIYTPEVHVFRGSEARGYPFVPVETYAFVACAAMANPPVERKPATGERVLAPSAVAITMDKIRTIFEVAARHGHDCLVLSAFGCGAFRNPPRHMARLFREVLDEPRFRGVFRVCAFAIFDDHNASKDGNYASFKHVLDPLPR